MWPPPPAPPVRDGLNPSRLRLPDAGDWTTVLEYLVARFPHDAARLREKVALGEVVAGDGTSITDTTAFAAREFVYLYRDPPAEVTVPFAVEILHRDENLLVVDKPHFLATMPRGGWVTETALVRLRRELDLPELSPAHRLDRLTAGVLVFTVRPGGARGAYQSLFAEQRVHKEYEALAPPPRATSRSRGRSAAGSRSSAGGCCRRERFPARSTRSAGSNCSTPTARSPAIGCCRGPERPTSYVCT